MATAAPRRPRRSRSPKGEGERLRDEILDATEHLLIRAGDVDAVSIRAIADAVGVTPPSIYLHFPDKDALMRAVCEAQFTRLEQAMAAAIDTVTEPVERLRLMGSTYVRFGVEHPEQYRLLLMTKGEFTWDDFESGRLPGAGAFRLLLRAVEDCMAAGAIRAGDAFLVATGLWTVVHGITSMRITMPTFPYVGDTLLDHLIATHMRGLGR